MKKSALLAACLVLCTANAWAYENSAAGFSVKDGQPFYKMESTKLYAFSSFSTDEFNKLSDKREGSVHIVNYYNQAEMSRILGVNYSDAYFAAEYDKLALLQRSQLDLQTVPSPLLNLNNYLAVGGKESLLLEETFIKQQLGNIKPMLRLDKRGRHKLITQSYLYKQGALLHQLDVSLVSANNMLYLLTSFTSHSDAAPDANQKEKTGAVLEQVKPKGKVLPLEAVQPNSLPLELRQSLWQSHWQLVKGFKTFQPQKTKQSLQFVDAYKGKAVTLPHDWVYGQLQFKEKEGAGCLTMAAPVENLRNVFAEMDCMDLYKHFVADAKASKPQTKESSVDIADQLPELDTIQQEVAASEGRKALRNFDSLLLTLSYQSKDKDFQAMADSALASRIGVEMLLAETLASLKNREFENFALESYAYKLDFAPNKIRTVITGRSKLFKEFTYDNFLQLDLSKNAGSLLLHAHKPNVPASEELHKSLRAWQF